MYRAVVTLPFSKMAFDSEDIGSLLLHLSQVLSAEDLQLGLRSIVIESDGDIPSAYWAVRDRLLGDLG